MVYFSIADLKSNHGTSFFWYAFASISGEDDIDSSFVSVWKLTVSALKVSTLTIGVTCCTEDVS